MATPYERKIEAYRARRLERLTGPDGWLTVVGLAWLAEGENAVAADPEAAVVLPGPYGPSPLGTIVVEGRSSTFFPSDAPRVEHAGEPLTEPLPLADDTADTPTELRVGSVAFHVIRRGDRLAVRVRDEESPARRRFRGIDFYPVDPKWRVEAAFEPYDPPKRFPVPTVLDMVEMYECPGRCAFELEGVPCALDVFLERPDDDLFVVFADPTNGSETFGGGRYLYTPQPGPDGIVVLDFNKAYNPPCVFTPHATCPLPLPQNRLPVAVRAGERRYDAGDASSH